MGWVKILTCRKCGADRETSVHIHSECLPLEKERTEVLGRAQMNLGQLKKMIQSGTVAFSKRATILNSAQQI